MAVKAVNLLVPVLSPPMPNATGKLGTRLLDEEEGSGAGASSSQNQVEHVQAQVDAVRTTMQENVNVMVENMEKSTNLEARSADLATQAQAFSRVSRSTRRAMWWQQCKSKLFLYGGCLTVLTIVVLIICAYAGAFDGDDDDKKK